MKITTLGKATADKFLDHYTSRKAFHVLPDGHSIQAIGIRNYVFVRFTDEIVVSDNIIELIKYLEIVNDGNTDVPAETGD